MKNRRFLSMITAMTICMSLFANFTIIALAEDKITYTADFTALNGKECGNAGNIYTLDAYTTANLTYADTTVDADGTIHLKGGNNGSGAYTNGSYIEFTAPAYGKVKFTGKTANYYIDGQYIGFGDSASIVIDEGQKLQIGERKTAESTVTSLSFNEYDKLPEAEEYTSAETTWDFSKVAPAAAGKNKPVISGTALVDPETREVQFQSATTGAGYLTIDFDEPIQNNVEFTFDMSGHSEKSDGTTLGQQWINFKVLNSEDVAIVSFSCHPYSENNDNNSSNFISIGGTVVKSGENVRTLLDTKNRSPIDKPFNIKTAVDYHARKVTITVDGTAAATGEIPSSALKDIAKFEVSSERTKISAYRYYSMKNLTVKEFTSTDPAAPAGDITNSYEGKTYSGVTSRVKAPTDSTNKPLVVFLSSKSRFGTDNEGQLYQAQYFFDQLADDAILAAPQTASAWDEDALRGYIAAAEAEYNPSEIVIIGYDEGATAAYLLSDVADKIIPIAGGGSVYGKVKAKYWAFGGFLDNTVSIADIRKPVNALQTAGAKVRYTEYPTDKHNILEKVSNETGVIDWIKGDVTDTKVVDLVLFAGQSNMAGRGDSSIATECPPGAGFEFHSITNPKLLSGEVPYALSTVSEPFGKNDNNSAINDDSHEVDRRAGDMVSSVMKAYYDKTGVPIVGVQASRGGEATDYFLDAARKEEMAARYSAAVKYLEESGYTVRKKFMVWCQGESDGESANRAKEDRYKKNTREIFDTVKAAGVTDIFMVKTGHYGGGEEVDARYKDINQWQQELADANDDVYAVADLYQDKYKAQMRDNYHYYQPVYNEIGETVGKAVAEIYKDEVVPSEPEEKEIIMPAKKPSITVNSSTSVTVKADTESNDTPVLIQVTRGENNELQAVTTYALTFDNDTAVINNISLKNSDELYVWSSLSGMKPLTGKKTVTGLSQPIQ